jgi:hypothetical protein
VPELLAIPGTIQLVLWFVVAGMQAFAFADAAMRPAEAFPAVDKQTKVFWLIILGIALAISLVFMGRVLGLLNIIGIIAAALGGPGASGVGEIGTTTYRAPYSPVSFAALAGRERGALFDPERTTPIHRWHREHDAVFEIDPGKLAEEARYDGIFVLRTNARITPLMAVLRYRDLLQVEELFRTAKALMRTRPIYHASDAAIRGHVFCSFLALILRKELQARCEQAGIKPEWGDLLRDLDRLQEITIDQDGQQVVLRTPAHGCTAAVFKAVGMALPRHVKTAA